MPNLPTKGLSQAHYDRVVGALPGTTPAEKAASYDAWLTNHLIDLVEQAEMRKAQADADASLLALMEQVRASLPDRVPYPPETAQ